MVSLSPAPPRKSVQSDNKNIPKNFTKAMFTYAMTNDTNVTAILKNYSMSGEYDFFVEWLKENKKTIHNTKQVRLFQISF